MALNSASKSVAKGGTDAKPTTTRKERKETLMEMGEISTRVEEILASVNEVSEEVKILRQQVLSSSGRQVVDVPGVVRSFNGGGRLIDYVLSVMPPNTKLSLQEIVRKVKKLGYRTNNKSYFPNAVGANLKRHPQIQRISRGIYLYRALSRPALQVETA